MGSSAAVPFGLSTIGQIAVTVKDVDRAILFYRDVLGMKLLFQVPTMGFFACDGVRLMIGTAEKPEEHYGSAIYFKVPDIRQAHRILSQRGAHSKANPICWRACPITTCGWPSSGTPTAICWL